MTPEQLFELHREKAERLAKRICWHYNPSGARQWEQEATQEALEALWKVCLRFQPRRQVLQRRKDSKGISETYWSIIAKRKTAPVIQEGDPYKTFWMFAVSRVSGAVIDFFRSSKLITRIPGEGVQHKCKKCSAVMPAAGSRECEAGGFCQAPRTMLHHERFLSASNAHLEEEDASTRTAYLDMFVSPDVADVNDGYDGLVAKILSQARAKLSGDELLVLESMCSMRGMQKEDVADSLVRPLTWVTRTLKSIAGKLDVPAY